MHGQPPAVPPIFTDSIGSRGPTRVMAPAIASTYLLRLIISKTGRLAPFSLQCSRAATGRSSAGSRKYSSVPGSSSRTRDDPVRQAYPPGRNTMAPVHALCSSTSTSLWLRTRICAYGNFGAQQAEARKAVKSLTQGRANPPESEGRKHLRYSNRRAEQPKETG